MSAAHPELTDRQRRVLEAAMEVFAERGFAAASTAEIARRAGVAEGTVFKTYKTKKDLLLGVVAPFFARTIAPILIEEVRTILSAPHASVEEFLRALFTNRVAFLHRHARLIRIALQEVPFHDEVRALAGDTFSALVLPDAMAVMVRFQREGKLRAGDPAALVRIVVGTFAAYAVTRILLAPDRAWDDDAEVELMVAVLARGLAPPDA